MMSNATKGLCPGQKCGHGGPVIYLVFMFISVFLIFSVAIPGLQATMRIVLFTQRSFAVGVQVCNSLSNGDYKRVVLLEPHDFCFFTARLLNAFLIGCPCLFGLWSICTDFILSAHLITFSFVSNHSSLSVSYLN